MLTNMSESQKIRVPNFSISEKTHLMRLIAHNYAYVIEDKKTDRASSANKEKAWQDIEKAFNASSTSSTYRNAASLKKCYENRKKELRKLLAEERKQTMLTGGGLPPKIKKGEVDELLMTILNTRTLVGIDSLYDDDAEETPIVTQEINNEIVLEYMTDKESQVLQSTNVKALEHDDNWKKYTPKQLKADISAPLTFSIEETEKNNSGEDHHKTPRKSFSRRRPTTVVKPLTSSDIAKKYDLLLDKRLHLLDAQLKHMATKNELILKKRKLEIEILEVELKNKKDKESN